MSQQKDTLMLSLGVLTDVHFGSADPKGGARHRGQLRKLSHQAAQLTADFVAAAKRRKPDFIVNLGDVVEDESDSLDKQRYRQFVEILDEATIPQLHVLGNHDAVNLSDSFLRKVWRLDQDRPLYRSLDVGGVHLVILATRERKDIDVSIDETQRNWLSADLAQNRLPVVVLMHHSASDQELRGNRWFEGRPQLCLLKGRKRLRALLARDNRTVLVLNGHLHWNHLDVIDSIPYVTLQSLVENLDDDAPGRPAAAHAWVKIGRRQISVEVTGAEPCRYQFARSASTCSASTCSAST